MNTNDAIETAHAFQDAVIVPVHYEGWAHFTQSRGDLEQARRARIWIAAAAVGSRGLQRQLGSRNHSAVPRGSLCHLLP
jgi:hypothetical protein